ncbi:MAG: hypothetical protein IKE65_10420 [Clostridia bacterium]|nr:hypothetical protein [Clostridia bacterium]
MKNINKLSDDNKKFSADTWFVEDEAHLAPAAKKPPEVIHAAPKPADPAPANPAPVPPSSQNPSAQVPPAQPQVPFWQNPAFSYPPALPAKKTGGTWKKVLLAVCALLIIVSIIGGGIVFLNQCSISPLHEQIQEGDCEHLQVSGAYFTDEKYGGVQF